MNLTVIKDSVIYNGKIYENGETIENANEVIGKSLIERGYVEEINEAEILTGHLDETQLHEMSYQDLKRLAAQMGLDTTGKKDELIARISGVEVNTDADAVTEDEPSEEETSEGLPNTSMPE